MTEVCDRCGREAPPEDARGDTGWEATAREDGTVELVCPECLARMEEDAIDEGRLWSEIERMPPEDLDG